jgi:DNA-binding response OmpR family regulator
MGSIYVGSTGQRQQNVGQTEPTSQTVQFDEYSFDPRSRELLRSGRKLRLAPQPARVLEILIATGFTTGIG